MNKSNACINYVYDIQAKDCRKGCGIEFMFVRYILSWVQNKIIWFLLLLILASFKACSGINSYSSLFVRRLPKKMIVKNPIKIHLTPNQNFCNLYPHLPTMITQAQPYPKCTITRDKRQVNMQQTRLLGDKGVASNCWSHKELYHIFTISLSCLLSKSRY